MRATTGMARRWRSARAERHDAVTATLSPIPGESDPRDDVTTGRPEADRAAADGARFGTNRQQVRSPARTVVDPVPAGQPPENARVAGGAPTGRDEEPAGRATKSSPRSWPVSTSESESGAGAGATEIEAPTSRPPAVLADPLSHPLISHPLSAGDTEGHRPHDRAAEDSSKEVARDGPPQEQDSSVAAGSRWYAPDGRWRTTPWPLVLSDLLAGAAAIVVGLLLLAALSRAPANHLDRFDSLGLSLAPMPAALVVTLALYGRYGTHRRRIQPTSWSELKDVLHAVAAAAFVTLGVGVGLHQFFGRPEIQAAPLVAATLVAGIFVPSGRALTRLVLRRKAGRKVRILIVGTGWIADQVCGQLAGARGVEVVGYVDDDPHVRPGRTPAGQRVLGGLADLAELCRHHRVDRVLVGFSRTHPKDTAELLRAIQAEVPISIVPRFYELLSWRSEVEEIFGLPVIDIAPGELGLGARVVKRAFDVTVAALALVVASPIMLAAAVAIRVGSPGPVLFRQSRMGRGGRTFTVYKLRSMRVDAEATKTAVPNEVDGPIFKARDDPRVTPVGRILRRASLDELPQLWNVLRGDMSLVGPRPFVVTESEQIDGWAKRRFDVRPGITGLWQISGRNDLPFDELRRLDYVYVASWSLLWDLRILWHTPAAVLARRGAY